MLRFILHMLQLMHVCDIGDCCQQSLSEQSSTRAITWALTCTQQHPGLLVPTPQTSQPHSDSLRCASPSPSPSLPLSWLLWAWLLESNLITSFVTKQRGLKNKRMSNAIVQTTSHGSNGLLFVGWNQDQG